MAASVSSRIWPDQRRRKNPASAKVSSKFRLRLLASVQASTSAVNRFANKLYMSSASSANAIRAGKIRAAARQQKVAQAALTAAETEKSNADSLVIRELQEHKDSVRRHIAKWTQETKVAEAKAANARAHDLLRRLPGATALGAVGLCKIAAKLTPRQPEQLFDVEDAGDLHLSSQP
jgi:hypothetical protein